MSDMKMVVTANPEQLLARATNDLFPLARPTAQSPWPTLSGWVVLRQGGLRDDLHARAARLGVAGWFDAPVCLFGELADRWHPSAGLPLSAAERLALLSEVVANHGGTVFGGHGERWVPYVDRTIGELVGEGIAPDEFWRCVQEGGGRDAFDRARVDTLARIYEQWCSALSNANRYDGRDRLARLARFIANDAASFAQRLGGRRDIRIVGLADLRGGWTQLLRALADSPAVDTVTLFTSHRLGLPNDLRVEMETEVDEANATALPTTALPTTMLLEAPDVAREADAIAVRVRALVDSGVPPARIAVLLRQARPGVELVTRALTAVGVPTTARTRTALSETAPARALRALLVAAAQSWTRPTMLDIAEHPLLLPGVHATVVDMAGRLQLVSSLDDWGAAFASLRERCVAAPGTHRERMALPPTALVEQTIAAWNLWSPKLADLEQSRTLREWLSWTHSVLTSGEWGVHAALTSAADASMAAGTLHVRAAGAIARLSLEWQVALNEFHADTRTLSAETFAERLAVLLSEDLITQPETAYGVIVSEALAAGWRAFDHVFIAGLTAGAFPLRLPPSSVLPDSERRRLHAAGLPIDAPDAWRDREQELFRVLCRAPSASLTLSWSAMDAEAREVVRSTYVDDVADQLIARHRLRIDDVAADADVAAVASQATGGGDDLLESLGILHRMPSQHVLVPGFPTLPRTQPEETRSHALRVASVEARRTREPSEYNGLFVDAALQEDLAQRFGESYVWSATQLEGLAKCQWSWFAARVLHVDERREASEQMEPSAIGTILHNALNRFFERARKHTEKTAVHLRADDAAWAIALVEAALDDAWSEEARRLWLGLPVYHDLVRAELRALLLGYVAFEIDHNEKSFNNRTTSSKQLRMGAALGEMEFGPVTLEGNGVRFQLRGTVDRIDIGTDERVENSEQFMAAIDYKTSKGSTPGSGKSAAFDDGVVLQVPLYAEVLRRQYANNTLARLEYRTLRSPTVVHQLQFTGVANKTGKPSTLVHDESANERMQAALNAAGLRVQAARDGVLPAKPVPSCGCSRYCPALDICRIPGGPVLENYP